MDEAQAKLLDRLPAERPDDALGEALGENRQLEDDLFTPDDPAKADLIAVCDRRAAAAEPDLHPRRESQGRLARRP